MSVFHFFSFQNLRNPLGCAMVFVSLLAVSSPTFAETVTIDFAADRGVVTYRASGFLHSFDPRYPPPQNLVTPLKPKLARWGGGGGSNFGSYPLITAAGARAQFVISDAYFRSIGWKGPAPCPINCSAWLSLVGTLVSQAKASGYKVEWDVFNEPGNPDMGWTEGWNNNFQETWKQTVLKIRSIDPNAEIVGPSLVEYNKYTLQSFLLWARTNNVMPTILSWHELAVGYSVIEGHVQEMRTWLQANGMGNLRIELNEYIHRVGNVIPGQVVHYIGAVERSGVYGGVLTTWDANTNVLDGLVTSDTKQPRSSWWAFKGYGDITGRLVNIVPSPSVNGVAGQDIGTAQARVVLGRNGGSGSDVQITLTGLDRVAYLGNKIRVVAHRVPNSGYNALASMTKEVDTTLTVSGTQATFNLPRFGGSDAYTIVLTPGSGIPTADTTAPGIPGNLSASAASSSQINLAWSASTDNVGITGYKIYRNGGTTPITTTNGTGTTYTDTGLAASTTYSYTVAAYDAAGNTSAKSASVSMATKAPSTDTTAPGIPGGFTATVISSSQVNLAWSASADNTGGSGLAGYKISRNGAQIATVTGTSYSNTGLAASTTYSYTGAAYDVAGNTSAPTASLSRTTSTAPVSTTGFPVYLRGIAPESASATISVTKPAGATGATLTLSAFDPDNPDEGRLVINGNAACTITLWGAQGVHATNNEVLKSIVYPVAPSCFNNGSNTLLFSHTAPNNSGYRIDGAQVAFSGITTAPPPPTGSLPDVIVTAVSYANGVFSATVKNQGSVATPTPTTTASAKIIAACYVDGAYKTNGTVNGPLAAGASVTVSMSCPAASGARTFKAHANFDNRFAESNTSNNTLSKQITVP